MSQILNKLRDVDPNNGEAIKEALSPFFQQLSKHTEVKCGLWLKALENALNRFPKYCMSQRGNIETYLAHFLNCTNYFIVIEAAKCAHALQQVRPTQEKSATAKSCWRDQMNALCSSAHTLLGAMFPNAVDIYQQMGKTQNDQQSPNSPLATALLNLSSATAKTQNNNTLTKQAILNNRLRNVFIFIQAMLVEVYPVAKPIRPQTILDVIVRSLSVTSGKNANQNIADVVAVKTQALRSLDALVACLGPNLIPFSPLVFRCVMQTLKWCSDNPSEHSSKVRCSAYSSLSAWLSALRSHRAGERGGWQDELADHVLADITPRRHTVQLNMSSQPTKNLSKKAKRKLANSMLMESNISSHMPGEKNKVATSEELNEELAIAALECAQIFFIVCGVFLKPTTYKRFQEHIVRACYSLHAYSGALRLRVLRALERLRTCAPSGAAPSAHVHHALHVYSVAATSSDAQISNFCSEALLNIRLHLHCGPPSLNFAAEPQPDAHSREEKKKVISDKNRAALEELLGPDKVPKQTETEEVITIADEPASKRRKIDEATEKISLSSESGSIEISDESETEDVIVQEVQVVIENDKVRSDEDIDIEPIVETESVNENSIEELVDGDRTKTIDIDDIHIQDTQLPNTKNRNSISEDKVDSTQPEYEKISDLKVGIYDAETQLPPNTTIYEAATQLPVNISNDDEEETPLSIEVVYDYPNTGSDKVPVLEKLDGDNLPSTNDTDDIQITCGQDVKNSQDVDEAKKSDVDIQNNEVKVNGVEKPVQNGDVTESTVTATVTSKDLNVEDMLADFVDEVNEDPTQATQV